MGHSCVKLVELLMIFFPFIFLSKVMFLYVLHKYKINTKDANALRMVKK